MTDGKHGKLRGFAFLFLVSCAGTEGRPSWPPGLGGLGGWVLGRQVEGERHV